MYICMYIYCTQPYSICILNTDILESWYQEIEPTDQYFNIHIYCTTAKIIYELYKTYIIHRVLSHELYKTYIIHRVLSHELYKTYIIHRVLSHVHSFDLLVVVDSLLL